MTSSALSQIEDETVPFAKSVSNAQNRNRYNTDVYDPRSSLWGDFERTKVTQSDDLKIYSVKKRSKWFPIVFGQMIALVAASQSAASFTLEYGMGEFFPFFLMLNAYLIMGIHMFCTKTPPGQSEIYLVPLTSIRIRTRFRYYVLLSILDITPNYLTLLSLKHTSLTSSTLLGSLTAPSIMLSCHFLLGKTYRRAHFVGVALCLIGGSLNIFTDLPDTRISDQHSHSLYGDILSVTAAILYGLGDALGEFWCKHVDRKEYLGMLGIVGSMFCTILVLLLEREAVMLLFMDTSNLGRSLGLTALYVPMLVLYYLLASLFLVSSDATLLNLSLQSSNIWAITFSILAFQETPSLLFFVALALVFLGVFIYEICGNSGEGQTSDNSDDPSTKVLKESSGAAQV